MKFFLKIALFLIFMTTMLHARISFCNHEETALEPGYGLEFTYADYWKFAKEAIDDRDLEKLEKSLTAMARMKQIGPYTTITDDNQTYMEDQLNLRIKAYRNASYVNAINNAYWHPSFYKKLDSEETDWRGIVEDSYEDLAGYLETFKLSGKISSHKWGKYNLYVRNLYNLVEEMNDVICAYNYDNNNLKLFLKRCGF